MTRLNLHSPFQNVKGRVGIPQVANVCYEGGFEGGVVGLAGNGWQE